MQWSFNSDSKNSKCSLGKIICLKFQVSARWIWAVITSCLEGRKIHSSSYRMLLKCLAVMWCWQDNQSVVKGWNYPEVITSLFLPGSQTVTSPTPVLWTSCPAQTRPNPPSLSRETTASGVHANSRSTRNSATLSWEFGTARPHVPTCTSRGRSWCSPATSLGWCPSSACLPPFSPSWPFSSTCHGSVIRSARLFFMLCAIWWCPWCSSWGFC